MDAAELKRRAQATRQRDLVVGAVKWSVVLPQPVEMRSLLRANQAYDGVVRDLVASAITGWSGVTQGMLVEDLTAEEAAAPAPFSTDLAVEYLNGRQSEFDALAEALLDAFTEHKRKREAALKN